ncbi:uncharacterized protein LOC124938286 isoform X2 [Impatiens glandulifera]|nr:uncharacterized protein LOC124938286 isoform X2 [Impatiens glandulifera]
MVAGTPMKKLLAEEMLKENESEQRQPGLIAKLMGLDGMPPQHHPRQRKDRHCFGTYEQGSASDFKMQNKHRQRRLNKTATSLGEREFRDVYEIQESIEFEKPRCSKRYSSSKDFFDTMDELNSNKDVLFTNGHQQPGSLFHRNLLDIKDATSITQPSCIQVLKPSKLTICESNNIGWKSDKEGISHVTKTLPTKIVVLKPNLDQMKSTVNSAFSTDSFSKSRSEDSREIAREITRRMRRCFHKDPVEWTSVLIGYAGDESSYSVYDSDSGSESEVMILTSRQSFHLSNRKKKSLVESFVNREAKKRLTDRWTMSQRQKAMEVFGKGNTLGEMLSIPDSANSSHTISSMDGSMGLHIQNPTHEGGTTSRNRSKLMKERNLRSDTKKLHRSQHMRNSSSDSSEMDCFYQPQMVANKEKGKLFEDSIVSSNELAPKTSAGPSMQASKSKAIQDPQKEKLPMPCPVTEPQSPGSSKEADHTSPVSVLESSPFTEEPVSGSNCFESVSAGLLELKMQLKLLKMESGSCADDTMTRSQNDNDVQYFEDDSLMSSYLTDILIDSCIQDWDLDNLISTWYSPECPISYDLFENLEKKYGDDTTWLREERRILFDRINVCLFEMLEPFTDSYPWLKLGVKKVAGSNMLISEMKWKLEEVLENEEKSTEKEISVDREMEWRDYREYMDVIGRELEILLLNELIEEAAFMTIICKG